MLPCGPTSSTQPYWKSLPLRRHSQLLSPTTTLVTVLTTALVMAPRRRLEGMQAPVVRTAVAMFRPRPEVVVLEVALEVILLEEATLEGGQARAVLTAVAMFRPRLEVIPREVALEVMPPEATQAPVVRTAVAMFRRRPGAMRMEAIRPEVKPLEVILLEATQARVAMFRHRPEVMPMEAMRLEVTPPEVIIPLGATQPQVVRTAMVMPRRRLKVIPPGVMRPQVGTTPKMKTLLTSRRVARSRPPTPATTVRSRELETLLEKRQQRPPMMLVMTATAQRLQTGKAKLPAGPTMATVTLVRKIRPRRPLMTTALATTVQETKTARLPPVVATRATVETPSKTLRPLPKRLQTTAWLATMMGSTMAPTTVQVRRTR